MAMLVKMLTVLMPIAMLMMLMLVVLFDGDVDDVDEDVG